MARGETVAPTGLDFSCSFFYKNVVPTGLKTFKHFSEKEPIALLENIQEYAEFIDIKSSVNICRDSKDNFLLALCADGKADYLITGDEDLLIIKKYKKTSIMKIATYLKK